MLICVFCLIMSTCLLFLYLDIYLILHAQIYINPRLLYHHKGHRPAGWYRSLRLIQHVIQVLTYHVLYIICFNNTLSMIREVMWYRVRDIGLGVWYRVRDIGLGVWYKLCDKDLGCDIMYAIYGKRCNNNYNAYTKKVYFYLHIWYNNILHIIFNIWSYSCRKIPYTSYISYPSSCTGTSYENAHRSIVSNVVNVTSGQISTACLL